MDHRIIPMTKRFLPPSEDSGVTVSVVVPAHNESGNIGALIDEIGLAMEGRLFEIIIVDDGSTDQTVKEAMACVSHLPVRVVSHEKSCGQSAAIRTGVEMARGQFIATLDGDGQNNPADIPDVLAALETNPQGGRVAMAAGQRVGRRDTAIKKWSSWAANSLRRRLLGDGARDTGCGLKVFWRDAFRALPYFDHMHRYLPALMIREGFVVIYVDVTHRPRGHGRSKYGTIDRLLVSIFDLAGVVWLLSRRRGTIGITEHSGS